MALRGVPSALTFQDTTVGGLHAVSIFSSADPADGLVLLDLPGSDTAALLSSSSHTTIVGGSTGQGHALIT